MFTTTITRTARPATVAEVVTREHRTVKAAEEYVNDVVANLLDNGATGGQMADWRNVTVYHGSVDAVTTIVTKRAAR